MSRIKDWSLCFANHNEGGSFSEALLLLKFPLRSNFSITIFGDNKPTAF